MGKWTYGLVVALVGCGSVDATKPDASTAVTGALTLATASGRVTLGGTASVAFEIDRGGTSVPGGAFTVHVEGLPSGVTALDVLVASPASSSMISFQASD